ncbi:MAG: tetratricopeptide repeat protein [Planctomycetota bacterium]
MRLFPFASPRPAALALLVAGATLLTGCQSDGLGLPGQEEAKDEQTRLEYYETAALTYYDGGSYQNAEIMAERWLKAKPGDKRARRVLARSKLNQGTPVKLREAEVILKDLVNLDWTHPTRGDTRFEVQGDLAQVYSDLADHYHREVIELEEELRSGRSPNPGAAEQRLAKQRMERNNLLAQAMGLWEQVLAANRDNPFALAAMAKGHLQMGNEDAGLYYAEQYLRLAETSQAGWRNWMQQFEAEANRQDGTLDPQQREFFIARMQSAREKAKAMHLLVGTVNMRRQDYPRAIQHYTAVIRMDPNVPAAFIERAQAYAAMGQFSLALDDVENYLEMTDPQVHRNERVQAMELLETYRAALAGGGRRGAAPPPAPSWDEGGGWPAPR